MKSHRNRVTAQKITGESFRRVYPESLVYLEAWQQRVKDARKRHVRC